MSIFRKKAKNEQSVAANQLPPVTRRPTNRKAKITALLILFVLIAVTVITVVVMLVNRK